MRYTSFERGLDQSQHLMLSKSNTIKWNKVNRDRYNIDAPGCKKKAYMDLDFRTLNGSEI